MFGKKEEFAMKHNIVRIGMGGWDLPPFSKLFYPPRPRKGFRKLQFYSQFFDFVEVNSPFYNTSLGPEHTRQWLIDVAENRNFVFCVKLYRGFTHTFNASRQDITSIQRMLEPLVDHGKFEGLVIQFPASFTNIAERRLYLRKLANAFDRYKLFLDVRHISWNSPLMYNFFQENKLHLINVDLPPLKRHMPLNALTWGGVSYFRLMGRNTETWYQPERGDRYHYLYGENELKELFRLIEIVRASARSTFVVFHNDPEANSLVNGFQLRHIIKNHKRVLIPHHLVQAFPMLLPISARVNMLHPLFADQDEPIHHPSTG